ncbi:hypothetical protein LJC63_12195, partial [Ruminococcaceae bacterium OttesenSCG-928-L11]|nr:hypothetical protein [Ruminococcaceae bacterium OttesenSCG-928-L11]
MKRILLILLITCLLAGCGKQSAGESSAPESSPPSSKPSVSLERSSPVSEPESSTSSGSMAPERESSLEKPSAEQSESQSSAANSSAQLEPVEFPAITEVSGGLQYTFSTLPQTAQQLEKILDQSDARHTAALFIAALVRYVDAPEDGIAMINLLRGPQPMSDGDIKFLKERL